MVSEVVIDEILEECGELLDDLLLLGFGESLPESSE
jgi:hypothetical protein